MITLFFLFVIIVLSIVFLGSWIVTKNANYLKILKFLWLSILSFISAVVLIVFLTSKKELEKSDYHGEYIVNRDYFPGKQANWQYNSFRFVIKENDSIYFFVTDKKQILKTYKGTITTTKPYASERLVLNMEQPTHHILNSNPTTYRNAWDFYLVFNSPKFNNVFFKKGEWKALDE